MKELFFRGDSRQRLKALPEPVSDAIGYLLYQVQLGDLPIDWKPMPIIGPGAAEIRINDEAGAFRVFYVAKFAHAVYVLHVMQKKTQQTPKSDIDLAARRYRDLIQELR